MSGPSLVIAQRPSWEHVASHLLSADTRTLLIADLVAFIVRSIRHWPAGFERVKGVAAATNPASKTRHCASRLPEITVLPSDKRTQDVIGLWWPMHVRIAIFERRSHTFVVQSNEEEMSVSP